MGPITPMVTIWEVEAMNYWDLKISTIPDRAVCWQAGQNMARVFGGNTTTMLGFGSGLGEDKTKTVNRIVSSGSS